MDAPKNPGTFVSVARVGPRRPLLLAAAIAGASLMSALTGCTTTTERLGLPPLRTVASVDLHRYKGNWYEIASFPQRYQAGCTGTMATYKIRDDGEIDVTNRCRQRALDGPEDRVEGRARVVDRATNAKLEVSFFRPFWGDYWIIDLAPDYSYAVVGHPSRDYLWILSRTPAIPQSTYDGILSRLKAQGYQTERLNLTLQPAAPASAAKADRAPAL